MKSPLLIGSCFGLALGLGLSVTSPARAGEAESSPATPKVHAWQDAKGVMHFSDTPPESPASTAPDVRPARAQGNMMVYAPTPVKPPKPSTTGKRRRVNGPLKPRDLTVGDGPSFIPRMDARCEWLSGRITSLKKLIDDGGRGADSIWQEEYGRRCGEWPRQCAQYPQQRPSCSGVHSVKPAKRAPR